MVYNYEDFLLEKNRIDFLKDNFVEVVGREKFDKLITLDPTNKKLYSQWIINLFVKKKLKEEDFYKVTEYITEFEKVKNKIPNKDINFYKSLPDLIKAIKDVGGTGKVTKDENYLIEDMFFINNGEAEIFAEDDKYLIVIPRTLGASQFYGNDTEWCTLFPDKFNAYTENGDLYIIIDKNQLNTFDINRKLQFNFEGTEDDRDCSFMDMLNIQLGTKIKSKFIKYFEGKVDKWFCLKYDYVDPFYESETSVGLNGKVGIINDDGEIIVPIKYNEIGNFECGLASVKIGNKWGFVDYEGKEITPIKYDKVWDFKGGEYVEGKIKNSRAHVKLNDKWGIIDETGKELTQIKYDSIDGFDEGISMVRLTPDRRGYIDDNGNELTEMVYDETRLFTEGKAAVLLHRKWGFIDKTGKVVIPFKYDEIISSFANGSAIVELDGKRIVIDETGKRILELN